MAECTVPYKVVLFVGVIQMCPTQSRLSAFLFCFLENCARTSRGRVHMWVRINTTPGNGRLGAAKLLWLRKGPKLWAIRMCLNFFIKDRVRFPSNGSSWLWQHLSNLFPAVSHNSFHHVIPPGAQCPSAGFPWDSTTAKPHRKQSGSGFEAMSPGTDLTRNQAFFHQKQVFYNEKWQTLKLLANPIRSFILVNKQKLTN